MPRYRCPACNKYLSFAEISYDTYHVSCRCGIDQVISDAKEPNRAWLQFLMIYDKQNAAKDADTSKSVCDAIVIDASGSTGARDADRLDAIVIDVCGSTAGPTFDTDKSVAPVPSDAGLSPRISGQNVPDVSHVKSRQNVQRPVSGVASGAKDDLAQPDSTPNVRSKAEIRNMIKQYNPDRIVRGILYTEHDYVCWYRATEPQDTLYGVRPEKLNLDAALVNYLKKSGVHKLYKFQHESFDAIVSGADTVIVAPTASGKTEAFLIPLLQIISETRNSLTALMVYPTKALAKDQYSKIRLAADAMGITLAIFDGDTPAEARKRIISSPPHILLTNFDVINYHLYHQTPFASLLHSVRILVVDEVHTYSGVFGSNVYYVIKRLNRITRYPLQIIAASATIHEPGRFCSTLFDRDVKVISSNQRRGIMDMIILYPSLRSQRDSMVDMANRFTRNGHRTLLFNNSHKSAEMTALRAKKHGVDIMVHRAGLTYSHRQKVETRFRNGNLMAISCTPTLELGIDIGIVDAVVSAVVPINRLLQRVGRAARRGQRGYAVLVLSNDPISQYYRNRPSDYFEDYEVSYIDPKNPFVEEYHISAMACDAPLRMSDMVRHESAVQNCIDDGLLQNRQGILVPDKTRIGAKFAKYNIRGSDVSVDLLVDNRKVGERAMPMALFELHPEAIYIMAGVRYKVKSLDWPRLSRANLSLVSDTRTYNTRPRIVENPSIQVTHDTKTVWGMQVAYCTLLMTLTFVGYFKSKSKEESTFVPYSDAPIQYKFVTKGVVFCIPPPDDDLQAPDAERIYAGACHATEHVIIEGGNMIIGGAARDLGGHSVSKLGAIFVYDNAVGGNGASRALYDRMEAVIQRGKEILRLCPCDRPSGCPRCTYSYRCGINNEGLNKKAALEVLTKIVDGKKSILNVSTLMQ